MKRFSKQATAIALLAVSIFAVPSGNTAIASRTNCSSVKKTYPSGIALNKKSIGTSRAEVNRKKYIQLKYLDKDLDGIICEIEKLQRKETAPVTTTATTLLVSLSCASGGACRFGDTGPGGGKVFYDAGSVQPWGRYLEAAPNDLSSERTWNDAVDAAKLYRGGGLSGWRIPTKDELNLLYRDRQVFGGFRDDFYWSSTEYRELGPGLEDYFAWFQIFSSGFVDYYNKNASFNVRLVRAF